MILQKGKFMEKKTDFKAKEFSSPDSQSKNSTYPSRQISLSQTEETRDRLSLYHVFYTVGRTGNISRAARELYISQPAISRAIQKLEESLDTELFKRSSRGVTLTSSGELLFEKVKEAFDLLEEGEDTLLHNRSKNIQRLRLGTSATLCNYVLVPHLKSYIKKYPQVRVTISCQSTYQTLQLLEQGKIDLGLIGRPKKLSGFQYLPLQKISDVFVSAKDYLKNQQALYLTEPLFHTATFMMLDEDNLTRQSVNTLLKERQIELRHILEVTSMDLLIRFAEIGMGVACVIREFVQEKLDSGALVEVPMNGAFPAREIGFVYRKDHDSIPHLDHFIQVPPGSLRP